MLKKLRKIMIGSLLAMIGLLVVPEKASAYSLDIPLTKVTDLENVPYPTTTPVYFFGGDDRNYSKFELTEPGEIKVYFRWGSSVKGKGTAWISRDDKGKDVIGSMVEISNKNNSLIALLDKGTYYLNCTWSVSAYDVGIALLYEMAFTDEKSDASDFINSNVIPHNKIIRGFITYNSPNDYYIFTLDKKALVTIAFSFDKTYMSSQTEGLLTLYDQNQIEITYKKYTNKSQGTEVINKLLNPGLYYIKLSGAYGATTLNVSPMYYEVNLTPDLKSIWTGGPVYVSISTTIDYKEMIAISKKVYEDDLGDKEIWRKSVNNKLYIPIEGAKFAAKENGYYSVRIEDKFGNYELAIIKISNIDKTPPKITGVKDGKSYKSSVTIKWSDAESGIEKATLNGKKVKSGVKVTDAGKYTLKVYDKVGNMSQVVFYVDFTAPKVSGVANGKKYDKEVTISFSDDLSGIKKVTINDEEIKLNKKKFTYKAEGKYVVKVWDNAGNYRKVTFYIEKKKK